MFNSSKYSLLPELRTNEIQEFRPKTTFLTWLDLIFSTTKGSTDSLRVAPVDLDLQG